jgi:hypothetical protein
MGAGFGAGDGGGQLGRRRHLVWDIRGYGRIGGAVLMASGATVGCRSRR